MEATALPTEPLARHLLFFNFLPKSVFVIDTICFLFVIFGQPAASFYAYFRPFRNKMTNILQNWRKSLERCLGFEPGTNELSNGGHFLPQSVFAIDPICLLKAHHAIVLKYVWHNYLFSWRPISKSLNSDYLNWFLAVWPNLAYFCSIWWKFAAFGKNLNLLWQFCCAIGHMFNGINGQNWAHHLTIWSHWTF